jgi:hypothetical protein
MSTTDEYIGYVYTPPLFQIPRDTSLANYVPVSVRVLAPTRLDIIAPTVRTCTLCIVLELPQFGASRTAPTPRATVSRMAVLVHWAC